MPEEINRLVTDALSAFLFTPSPDADENLFREGIPREKIYQVGDIMVDSLLFHLEEAKESPILAKLGLLKGSSPSPKSVVPYALLTLHRPSNVDDQQSLHKILAALELISQRIAIIYPIHPRTKKQLAVFHLQDAILFHDIEQGADLSAPGIHGLDPLGYLDFLSLMRAARFVLTDSGGIQEETTMLGVPCLTLRDTTERPITISEGTNVLVWNDTEKIVKEAYKILEGKTKKAKIPTYWDGKTAGRIIKILVEEHVKGRERA
jgi:UDP-N-acetylglucosamine 2-epimerase (non-hydrolysing)